MNYSPPLKKLFLALCIIPTLTACFGPKYLQSELNRDQYPIGYLHDSPKVNEKLDVVILPEITDHSNSACKTTVLKDAGHQIFLLIFSDFNFDFTIKLGKNSLQPDFYEFIQQSFIKESQRSGRYLVKDTTILKRYTALIEIINYEVTSKYHKEGGGASITLNVMPARGTLTVKASLIDGNSHILYTKEYTSEQSLNYIKTKYLDEHALNQTMMNNMAETLSQCIKETIAQIVSDINIKISE